METLLKKFGRQALHAYKIQFIHPITNVKVVYEANLPKDIENLAKRQ